MTRTMYDSVSEPAIPAHATLVAGYEDGLYVTAPVLRKRKPAPEIVTLTVNGSTRGTKGIDCEKGDATPKGTANWCKAEIVDGHIPVAYTYLAGLRDLIKAFKAAGISPEHVTLWTAHYTNKPHICGLICTARYGIGLRWRKRIMATQYMAYPGASPGHYDVSLVADHWPGVDHEPKRMPKPPAKKPAAKTAPSKPPAKPVAKRRWWPFKQPFKW